MRKCFGFGFSLLELLIVIAIMAILVALAYPNYQHYWARSYRKQAMTNLLALAQQLDSHYLSQHTYAGTSCESLGFKCHILQGRYELSIVSATGEAFTVQAQAFGSQLVQDAACSSLQLRSDGQRLPESCWI